MASLDPVKRTRGGVRRVLASLNGDGRYGIALLCATALLLLPVVTGEAGREGLRYDRNGLAHGELWRLLTGHFVHLSFEHAALNSLGLVLVWALFARDYPPRQWLAILLGSILAIDAGLWLRDSTTAWYVGSSGALHGAMAAGTLAHVRRGDLDGWILTAFLIVKLGYEQWSGQLPFAEGALVVVDAHLYGALGGVIVAAWFRPSAHG